MQLRCQSCQTALHPVDVDFEALHARCRHCGWRFGRANPPYRTAAAGAGDLDRAAEPDEPAADEVALTTPEPWPRGVTLRRDRRRDQIAITLRTRVPRALVKASAFLFVVLAFGTAQVFVNSEDTGSLAWRLLAGLAALALYVTLALHHNRITISTDPGGIAIARGPFPWFGSRFIARADVQQLWVAVIDARVEGVMLRYYELRARTADGDLELVTEIESPVAALFLEREVEDHLGIEDAMIHGQYRPRLED